ncbi:putative amidoligase domain-containing protein [Paenibacillus mendelii]|uniref:PhiEco32-like amidoligase-type 2 protein n=1 Tax=Paenibacillus mendelii TaxID=206163 RepID=A0ABV6J6C9_9BACL|nr:hypothetical protein [Paenibacillus mendelii]MCQ6560190.1 hypothetical protein [Paenibacillus mendelii]
MAVKTMSVTVWLWGAVREVAANHPIAWVDGEPESGDAVVVWGAEPLPEGWRDHGQPWVLNSGASSFAKLDGAALKYRLERAGAAVAEKESGAAARRSNPIAARGWSNRRRLIVNLFQLEPVSIELVPATAIGGSGYGAARLLPSDVPLYRRASKLSVRALYAAGLDCGIVEAVVQDDGSCSVTSIRLPEDGALRAGTVWHTALRRFTDEWRKPGGVAANESESGILLGADPEFLLVADNGKVVSASRYLEGGHGSGCDAVVIGGRVRYPIAELRPAPAASPDRLTSHIRQLLLLTSSRVTDPSLRWLAGGMPVRGFALGGHIHLSGVRLTSRLLRQLDSYVAFPLSMVESDEDRKRRPRYGALGDFRKQPHGGFEYRTLPSWLVSPMATKAALALTLLCALEGEALTYLPTDEERFVEAYYAGDLTRLRACIDPLASVMAGTASWRKLSIWIEPFLNAIQRGEQWDERADIRIKWRIPPYA